MNDKGSALRDPCPPPNTYPGTRQGRARASFKSSAMRNPPKLWQLLVLLAVAIIAIVYLNHYAATHGVH